MEDKERKEMWMTIGSKYPATVVLLRPGDRASDGREVEVGRIAVEILDYDGDGLVLTGTRRQLEQTLRHALQVTSEN